MRRVLSARLLGAVAAAIVLLCAPAAFAAPCFDAKGRPLSDAISSDCNDLSASYNPNDGDILAYDENKKPLYQVHALPQKSKNAKRMLGIKDMSGRIIGPVQFQRVYVVSRTLGVGEFQEKNRPSRAFFIDLRTGDVRATPYTSIMMTYSIGPEPFLLGAVPGHYGIVQVLYPTGADTGLMLKDIVPTMQDRVHNAENGVVTLGAGFLSIGYADAIQFVTLTGKTPAGGRKIVRGGGYGIFAEVGPPPAGAEGPNAGQLLFPLDGMGEVATLAPDFLGYVSSSAGSWYSVRRMPEGVRFYMLPYEQPLVLAGPPAGEPLRGVHFVDRSLSFELTDKGWRQTFRPERVFATIEEAKTTVTTETSEFLAAAAIDQAKAMAAQSALREQQQAAWIEDVRARMKKAKAENWGGPQLYVLQQDVRFAELELEYENLGLYVSDDFRRQVCNTRSSAICNSLPEQASSSSSGFTSTWEQAFKNASALNARQGAENCAAALKGAARACTIP